MKTYRKFHERSIEDPVSFWKEQAESIDWFNFPVKIYDAKDDYWFKGGKLNSM